MTQRTYTQKDGTVWEWEETKETIQALKDYRAVVAGNYQGPLYAPHPDITKNSST